MDLLPETEQVGYTYFQIKIAEMTLKLDQYHWQRHSSAGNISLSMYLLSFVSYLTWHNGVPLKC